MGARVLVYFLGLGVPGWGVGLGVHLGPMVYLLGTGPAPTKTPCERGRNRPGKWPPICCLGGWWGPEQERACLVFVSEHDPG